MTARPAIRLARRAALLLTAIWICLSGARIASAQSDFPVPPSPSPLGNSILDDDDRPTPRSDLEPDEVEATDRVQPPQGQIRPYQALPGQEDPGLAPPRQALPPQDVPPPEIPLDDFASVSGFDDTPLDEPPGLAGIPDMFGDTFLGTPTLFYRSFNTVGPAIENAIVDLPLAAGSYRTKISEHNNAIPVDRAYVNYNHFNRAFTSRVRGQRAGGSRGTTIKHDSLDRYVVGLEKTLFGGDASIEVRMPFAGLHSFDFARPPAQPAGTLGVRGDQIGNLTFILKDLLYVDDFAAYSWGIGIETPTGSDAKAIVDAQSFHVANDAIHISPFFAVLVQPAPRWFFNGFAQLAIPTNGNEVTLRDLVTYNQRRLGSWNDQTLLHLDGSIGWWLYQNPCAPFFKGLAPLLELHYSTNRLQGEDIVAGHSNGYSHPSSQEEFFITHGAGQFDLFTATIALHADIGCNTQVRVGAVAPLVERNDRLFDSEFTLQLSRHF